MHRVKAVLRGGLNAAAHMMKRARSAWMVLAGKSIVATRQYGEYQQYLAHQREKTCDADRIAKWHGEEWEIKLEGFKDIFSRNWGVLGGKTSALCLGARTGQEVRALWDLGIDAIGVDLVAFSPYTVEGDVHDLKYDTGKFDFVFTNIFDHVLYPDKFCEEIERVTAPSGIMIIHLQVGMGGDEYTETMVHGPDAVIRLFGQVNVIESRAARNTFDEMNWEIILQKLDDVESGRSR